MESKKNWDKIIKEILQLVEAYSSKVPKGCQLLKQSPPQTLDDTLDFLCQLFIKEEQAISEEHKKRFVTDDYENGVREFAAALMNLLIPHDSFLKNHGNYKELCTKKHIAYGYYKTINPKNQQKLIAHNMHYEKSLYLGLAKFYREFHGNFSDNEEAIELLCKYYPQKLELTDHIPDIASALYSHISLAGTPYDRGYAYQGIPLIEKYIHKLPEAVVLTLVGKYTLSEIINNKVHRHQLFAILQQASLHTDKELLKFWYLDSLILDDLVGSLFFDKMREQGTETDDHNNYYDYQLADTEHIICDDPPAYWNNDPTPSMKKRVLFLYQKPVIEIHLKEDKTEGTRIITIQNTEEKSVTFPYKYTDWLLESLQNSQARNRLQSFVFGTDLEQKTPGSMTFSLVYLDHYRGLQDQMIDLDHRFIYDSKKHFLQGQTSDIPQNPPAHIPHIYGKSVYSLSCIVGKNATGKTSIIDFLRETFFKMLKFIEEQRFACENGYVEESEYEDYHILDKNARFLVVFSLGTDTYFFTNIQSVKIQAKCFVKPFGRGIYKSVHELSKVAYFSSQLRGDQNELWTEAPLEIEYEEQLRKKQKLSKVMDHFRQADYSEKESFIQKGTAIQWAKNQWAENRENMTTVINKELCYQLSFLKKSRPQDISRCLDISTHKEFTLVSYIYGHKTKTFTLEELECKPESEFEEFIFLPDATLKHFSAGQYAKFSFLSRLHWFLEGDEKEIWRYNQLAGDSVLSSDEVLLYGETALIFIDEGEIYYHPEWQRQYIKLILEMINAKPRKVQIIVTTNSPFMISDLLSQDITYLSKEKNRENLPKKETDRTLGQNIHKLLKDNFFMEYTIGEYSREIIENIMLCLQNDSEQTDLPWAGAEQTLGLYFDQIASLYDAFHWLIDQIGEPIYKHNLMKMLEESPFSKQQDFHVQKQIQALEKKKRELQEEIDKLKGNL